MRGKNCKKKELKTFPTIHRPLFRFGRSQDGSEGKVERTVVVVYHVIQVKMYNFYNIVYSLRICDKCIENTYYSFLVLMT